MDTMTGAFLQQAKKRFETTRAQFALTDFAFYRVRIVGVPMPRYFCAKNDTRCDFQTLADADAWLADHKARAVGIMGGHG